MAGKVTYELDYEAIGRILRGPQARAIVRRAADKIAAYCEDPEIEEFVTDRAIASVSVFAEDQARDGMLSRAAARAGLRIRR